MALVERDDMEFDSPEDMACVAEQMIRASMDRIPAFGPVVPRGPFQDVGLQSVFRGGTETGRAMADCLHCEINQLVQQRLEGGDGDLAEIASMVAESLADLILLAPEGQQANLIAYVVSGLGQMFLEKSGAVEGGSSATH
jgi:hypothetical protein